MPEYITIQEKVERKTYLKGKFRGKYVGILDERKSDGIHENFYDLEVLEGQITCDKKDIRKWQEGDEFHEFREVGKCLTKLPHELPCKVIEEDGTISHYKLHLQRPKLINYDLTLQQYDQEKVFGVVEGEISGFLIHYDIRDIIVEKKDEKVPSAGAQERIEGGAVFVISEREERQGDYIRKVTDFSDGTTKRGNWVKIKSEQSVISLWDIIVYILFFLFILAPFILLLVNFFWPVLIIAGLILLINFLQPIISFVGRWLIRLLCLGFVFSFIAGLISVFQEAKLPDVPQPVEDTEEVVEVQPEPVVGGDTLISHFRKWQDYDQREYSGYFKIKLSDFRNAARNRQNLPIGMYSSGEYNKIVASVSEFENQNLNLLYSFFDSLKTSHKLGDKRFAEVITSSIQDIPYALVLDQDCNSRIYDDAFITQYLSSGKECVGNIKYGLFSPSEFIGSLKGDCDTRTLLLYTILDHYGYDVAMLSSDVYRHSIIGINLPYDGVAKLINGKRFVVWETTAVGLRPGVISPEQSEMHFWSASLLSKP
ncbi:hypothetical protein [Nibribacter koreensis]|uniref:Transglutaminase-like superfamily protein n=1 Tax=Nibribacter koreensis TaxID=1084519 RepID=A0ABP8FD58_9BACT